MGTQRYTEHWGWVFGELWRDAGERNDGVTLGVATVEDWQAGS